MMLWKCCTQNASKFGKLSSGHRTGKVGGARQKSCFFPLQQWPQNWKRSVFIPIPKKDNAKECSNYRTTAFISHARKVILKILQARFQQYANHELPDVQAGFQKGRGPRDQIDNIC